VEGHGKPHLPVLEQIVKALVGLGRVAEARELPHGPQPAAIHRLVDTTRVRILARKADVAQVVAILVVGRRVERLDVAARAGLEEIVALLRRLLVAALPLGRRALDLARPGGARTAVRGRRGRLARGSVRRLDRGLFHVALPLADAADGAASSGQASSHNRAAAWCGVRRLDSRLDSIPFHRSSAPRPPQPPPAPPPPPSITPPP